MCNTPCYPVSPSYARATLIINIPWRDAFFHKLSDTECLIYFNSYIKEKKFPKNVLLQFHRMKLQYAEKRVCTECVEDNRSDVTENDDVIDDEDACLIRNLNSIACNQKESLLVSDKTFDRGLSYEWSRRIFSVRDNWSIKTKIMVILPSLPFLIITLFTGY